MKIERVAPFAAVITKLAFAAKDLALSVAKNGSAEQKKLAREVLDLFASVERQIENVASGKSIFARPPKLRIAKHTSEKSTKGGNHDRT